MQTNTWRFLTVEMPGTNTDNFRSVFKHYFDLFKPATFANIEYQYNYDEGDGLTQYQRLWTALAQGNPIAVNYKSGATKGHFAVLVGMEKVGYEDDISNDMIFLANPREEDLPGAISYGAFLELWRRDYYDFGALELVGEHRYTRLNLWDTNENPPTGGGGGPGPGPGGGGGDNPPIVLQ